MNSPPENILRRWQVLARCSRSQRCMATSLLKKLSRQFSGKRSAPRATGLGVATSVTTPVRTAPEFLLLVLALAPTVLSAQGGSAPTTTTLSATGANPYTLTATVVGHSVPAPTGSVTFTDLTINRALGTATLGAATTMQTFGNQTPYSAGSSPFSVAVGDFNGDGKPDLAVGNLGSSTISVLLGQGNGAFGPPSTYDTGLSPSTLAVGDFNGDGKPDLAVANFDENTISVLLNLGKAPLGRKVLMPRAYLPLPWRWATSMAMASLIWPWSISTTTLWACC